MIPYGRQNISAEDITAVIDVLKSDYLTQGPKVPEFEKKISDYTGSKFSVAVNSATSALHIACLALDVQQGDVVWTSPISFVASANCALYCGASIDFVDIESLTGNMSVDALEKKLAKAALEHSLPKVIIVVHLAGQSCDMQEISALTNSYNIKLIEDASHAIGAQYNNSPVGCCQYSDISVFSFHPVKIITSAEGGMALTNNAELAEKLRLYRSHGITSQHDKMTEASHGPWYYQQIALGFNYRMTELQAALGISQFQRLDSFVNKRNELAKIYDHAFEDTALECLTPSKNKRSAYHLYIVLLPNNDKNKHQESIVFLREKGIFAHVHYIPIHLQPYYQQLGFREGDFPNAEHYYLNAISLPLYPDLTPEQQQHVIAMVKSLL
jgi:UDP-4-amino-4,6-dideoxy-N-acetyl-beta-L-altrosamine transaminase